MSAQNNNSSSAIVRWLVIAVVAVIALLGSYTFAAASRGSAAPQTAATQNAVAPTQVAAAGAGSAGGSGSASGGCACCGGGSAAPAQPITGQAESDGAVQKISVDVSKGYYDPNVIKLKAGVPAEITFSQSSGCTAIVESRDLNFSQDLTNGPATVKLPALAVGTYGFNCGMSMVFGTIVVE